MSIEGVNLSGGHSRKDFRMAPIDDLLHDCREVVATMRGNIASFETRNMTLYGDRGGERVDITQEWKSRMRQQTYKLQQVIADLEG